jgi:hypothetical protein
MRDSFEYRYTAPRDVLWVFASSEQQGGVEWQDGRSVRMRALCERPNGSRRGCPTRALDFTSPLCLEENMNKLNLLVIAMAAAAGLTGCAMDPVDGEQASDQQTLTNATTPSQDGNDDRARQIAQAKHAALAGQGITVNTSIIQPDAAACGKNGPTGSSTRTNNALAAGVDAAKIRTGSSTGCTAVGQINPGEDATYFCFTFAGNFSWTFLQDIQSGKRGWTRDDLLRDDGSFNFCGF